MSRMGGISLQPEFVLVSLASTGAPQAGQERAPPSEAWLHQGHRYLLMWSLGHVMDVHGLDADPTGTADTGERHAGAPKKARGQLLHLDIHGDAGVLIEERAGLDLDALAGSEAPLEDIAVAVEQQEARLSLGDEPIHEHPLPAEQDVAQSLDADVGVIDVLRGE